MNTRKRVSLNRRGSSLLIDYQAMIKQEELLNAEKQQSITLPSEYTRQLVASALSNTNTTVKVDMATTPNKLSITPPTNMLLSPRLLKPSLKTPNRSASAPCSPVTGLKTVHFNQHNLEEICLFRKAQTPLAISQKDIFWATDEEDTTSSDDNEEEEEEEEEEKLLAYPNWSTRLSDIIDKKTKLIRIEKSSIKIADNNNYIIGKVSVRNIDYHKTVTVRCTWDFWSTIQNIQAEYQQTDKNNQYDVFTFKINIPSKSSTLATETLYFAINYTVGANNNQVIHWDNNDGRNYEVKIQSTTNKNKVKNSTSDSDNVIAPTSTKSSTTTRYDFGQSIHQAKTTATSNTTTTTTTATATTAATKPSTVTTTPIIPLPPLSKAFNSSTSSPSQPSIPIPIPIPMLKRSNSSPTGLSCHSPLASSPNSFMDQSYMELVNKYCFYSTSPSRSPMSING